MSHHIWILGVKNKYRGNELERQLASSGLAFSNYWGTDAGAVVENPALAENKNNFAKFALGRSLTPGEKACAQGHLAIYEEFLQTNHEWALIFEDDARLMDKLDFLKGSLPVFKESVVVAIHDGPGFRFTRHDKSVKLVIDQFVPVQRLLELPSCAHGYLINRKAIESLNLKKARELLTVADWPYVFSHKYLLYASVKPLVTISNNSNSLIGERGDPAAQEVKFWIPSLTRVVIAVKLGIDFKLAIYREIVLKIKRVYNKCVQNLRK